MRSIWRDSVLVAYLVARCLTRFHLLRFAPILNWSSERDLALGYTKREKGISPPAILNPFCVRKADNGFYFVTTRPSVVTYEINIFLVISFQNNLMKGPFTGKKKHIDWSKSESWYVLSGRFKLFWLILSVLISSNNFFFFLFFVYYNKL